MSERCRRAGEIAAFESIEKHHGTTEVIGAGRAPGLDSVVAGGTGRGQRVDPLMSSREVPSPHPCSELGVGDAASQGVTAGQIPRGGEVAERVGH